MRALIVGCGSIGARRARLLHALGVELYLTDIKGGLAHNLCQELNGSAVAVWHEDLDFAIRDCKHDVALICTPPNTHLEIAQRCATAGLNLFIEKPLADKLDREAIQKLVYTMQVNGCMGIMGQSWRFLPSLREYAMRVHKLPILYASIVSGQYLGDWHQGVAAKDSPYASQGIVQTSFAHSLDTAQWLFGGIEAVAGLVAGTGAFHESTPDVGTLLLRMKSGAQVVVHNDFWMRPREDYVFAVAGNDESQNLCDWMGEPARYSTMYIEEVKHLVRCIERKYQGQPDIFQGVANLEWMMAAQKASDTGTWQRIDDFWSQLAGRK